MMLRLVLLALLTSVSAHAQGPELLLTRPDAEKGPTRVAMRAVLIDISEISSARQNFTANLFYTASWRDPRLAFEGNGPTKRPLGSVWHPRIQVVNQQRAWDTFPKEVEVHPDGTVRYRQRLWGNFSQPLRLQNFPFDAHRFTLTFATAGFRTEEIEIASDDSGGSKLGDALTLPDWNVSEVDGFGTEYVVVPGAPKLPAYQLRFQAERRSGYFVAKVIVPLMLVVFMSWAVFWIEPSESSRISVSVTAMLTLIAYRFAVQSLLPQVSYMTRLDTFILGATGLVFAALIEVIIGNVLVRRGFERRAVKVDRIARVAFPLAFLLMAITALGPS